MGQFVKKFEFCFPTRVLFGRGAARQLPGLLATLGKRVLLVGYSQPSPLHPLYTELCELLTEKGLSVTAYLAVDREPTLELVSHGYSTACHFAPDVVLAVGGGSVLDTAKLMVAGDAYRKYLEQRGRAGLSTTCDKGHSVLGQSQGGHAKPSSLVLVPTTFGTGSEVTEIAVFTDELPGLDGKFVPVKVALNAPELRGNIAVVDPSLCESLSLDLLQAQVTDLLGHIVESVMSRGCTRLSFLLASEAFRVVVGAYHQVSMGDRTPDLIEELAWAGLLGGFAVQISGVTVGHALAHAMGAVLEIPHAIGVGLTLPAAVEFNRSVVAERLRHLERILLSAGHGFGPARAPTIESLVDEWTGWTVKRASTLMAAKKLESIESAVVASAECGSRLILRLNPRPVGRDDLLRLVRQVLCRIS